MKILSDHQLPEAKMTDDHRDNISLQFPYMLKETVLLGAAHITNICSLWLLSPWKPSISLVTTLP